MSRASIHDDDKAIADADGKRVNARRAAEATDAVMKYFQAHPEAGPVPYFHHRAGIAAAVIRAITQTDK